MWILKSDINFLYKTLKNILLELNEECLDHIIIKENLFWRSF